MRIESSTEIELDDNCGLTVRLCHDGVHLWVYPEGALREETDGVVLCGSELERLIEVLQSYRTLLR